MPPKLPPASAWKPLIKLALAEDLGRAGDLTTQFFVPPSAKVSGRVVAKQAGVVCGLPIAAAVFSAVSRKIKAKAVVAEGAAVKPGQAVMTVSGGREVLTAERTALNFLQRMSGVATLTAKYAAAVRGTAARVYDTRKTLPGWRALDKYAVACGGGVNHRVGLYDAVLLKDNHWALGDGNLSERVAALRRRHRVPVELEAADLTQVERAVAAGADVVLLDNMQIAQLERAISLIRSAPHKTQIEISGGVSLETIALLARLGPDRISIGRLTHSAPALDLSLEIP